MQNRQEKRDSKWSKAVSLMRVLVEIVRVRARLRWFSSNPCAKAVQNDHIGSRPRILMPHRAPIVGFSAPFKASVNRPLHRSANASRFSHKVAEILAKPRFLN